jgi:hypothetical protein
MLDLTSRPSLLSIQVQYKAHSLTCLHSLGSSR